MKSAPGWRSRLSYCIVSAGWIYFCLYGMLVGDFQTSELVLPYLKEMESYTSQRNLYVSVCGGGTANAFITGYRSMTSTDLMSIMERAILNLKNRRIKLQTNILCQRGSRQN